MPSLYEISIPVMIRGLKTLEVCLKKTVAKEGLDLTALPTTRLFPDMLPLSFQIQTACNCAKKSVWRLGSSEDVPFPDDEKTIEELITRVAKTVELLEAMKPEDVKAESEQVELKLGPLDPVFLSAKEYVLDYAIPNFFFHIQTVYCILRVNGVDLGKVDYLTPFMGPHMPAMKPAA